MVYIKKRFIAGAICPKCQLMDKTVVYEVGGQSISECVRCGLKQFESDAKKESAREPNKKIIWLHSD